MLNELFNGKVTEEFDELITIVFNGSRNTTEINRKIISSYIEVYVFKDYNETINMKLDTTTPIEMCSNFLHKVKNKDDFEAFKQHKLPLLADSEDYKFFEHVTKRIETDYDHIELFDDTKYLAKGVNIYDDKYNNYRMHCACTRIVVLFHQILIELFKNCSAFTK